MDNVSKFKQLKEKIDSLNEDRVRLETNLENAKKQKEEVIIKILEITKTTNLEEAMVKAEAIQTKLDKISKEVEELLKEVEEYEATNK